MLLLCPSARLRQLKQSRQLSGPSKVVEPAAVESARGLVGGLLARFGFGVFGVVVVAATLWLADMVLCQGCFAFSLWLT